MENTVTNQFTSTIASFAWGSVWRHNVARSCLAFLAAGAVLLASPAQAQQGGFSVGHTAPADGATDVPVDANIVIKFTSPVYPSSMTVQSVLVNGRPLGEMKDGAIAFPEDDSAVVLFRMKPDSVYRISLDSSVKDTQGNALAKSFSWRYATSSRMSGADAPVKDFARYPRRNDRQVPVNAPITLAFTSELEPASLSADSVRVVPTAGGSAVSGKMSVQGRRAVFRPDVPLEPNRTYEVQLAPGVKGKSGKATERASSWQFTTGDGPSEGQAITDCWYESYAEPEGLRMVFHVAAENLVKPGRASTKAATVAQMPGASSVLKAAVVSLSGLVPTQPLSTPTDASAKEMPATNWAPNTVAYAAYTHGGGSGQGNSVADNSRQDPEMEPVTAAVKAALGGELAVTLHDSGDVIEHGDEAKGDGVYSGRLALGKGFPSGQALMAFSIVLPDGQRTEPVTIALYVLPPEPGAEPAAAGKGKE